MKFTGGSVQNHPKAKAMQKKQNGCPISEKRREAKDKRKKERYTHLNAELQRITRKDKKAFPSDQCKERGKQ